MRYEYQNRQTGEIRSVIRPMHTPPPEEMLFNGVKFRRIYSNPAVIMKNAAPGSRYNAVKGPQVSHSLPLMPDSGFTVRSEGGTKIREYADGTRADTRGRRIMETEADVSRARKAGFTREKD